MAKNYPLDIFAWKWMKYEVTTLKTIQLVQNHLNEISLYLMQCLCQLSRKKIMMNNLLKTFKTEKKYTLTVQLHQIQINKEKQHSEIRKSCLVFYWSCPTSLFHNALRTSELTQQIWGISDISAVSNKTILRFLTSFLKLSEYPNSKPNNDMFQNR